MNEGYVKVYRKTITSQVFQSEGLFKVWMWCLLKANHKGQWVPIKTGKGVTEVWIGPGQFIFGRKSAAKELNMPPSTVRNRIRKLELMGNIRIEGPETRTQSHFAETGQNQDRQKDRQYSIIIIINWDTYQASDRAEGHPKRTAKGQPKDTNKNVKNKEYIYGHFDLEGFNAFWKVYPRKVKKKDSLKIWREKLKPDEQLTQRIISAVEKQTASEWKDRDKKHIPHPSTWLNGERWNDEIEQPQRWDEKTY